MRTRLESLLSDVRPASSTDPKTGSLLFAAHLLTIFGIALSNVFFGLMILWSGWRREHLDWRWSRRAVLFVPAGLYMVFFVGSVVASVDPAVSAEELRDVLIFATLFLAPVLVRGADQVRRLCDLLIGLCAFLALHGAWQYYFTDYGSLHQRIVGLFSHVQTFAGILVLGILVTVARLTRDGLRRPWLWLALAPMVWTLLLTLTRGAWVAAGLTVALFGVVRAGRRFPVYALLVAALLALLVASAPRQTAERMSSIIDLRDSSNYDRLCMAEAALYMVSERPLFGIGPEMVEERYPIYRHPTAPRVTIPHLHSTFLQRAGEQGLLGLGSYLWLMIAAGWLAWRGLRRDAARGGSAGDLYLVTLLVLVGFNIAGLFEDNWRDTEVRRFVLFFLAIPLCLDEGEDSDVDTDEDPEGPT